MAYRAKEEKTNPALVPPQSLDAEQAVLGSMLKDADALGVGIEQLISPGHFYYPKHQMIFRVLVELYEKSEPCDLTTVSNELKLRNELDRIGGRLYLTELIESVASTANVAAYCKIVLDKSILRQLIQTSNQIIHSAQVEEQSVDDLLDAAEVSIFRISESRLRKGFISLKQLMPATFEQIENLQSPDSTLVGLPCGYPAIDVMTNGLHAGELIIVAGRPSMGKSAFVMNIAEHVAVTKKVGVGVFSIEMSAESLALRMLCGRARISQQRLRSRKIQAAEWPRFTAAAGVLSEAPIFIDDSATLTSLELRAKARRLKSQHDVGMVVVDYLQMMTGSGRYENRQQEMTAISRSLKALAKELQLPILACSQLSRMVEQRGGEKRPQLSDLRESGAIEQDADVVIFVYRAEHYIHDKQSDEYEAIKNDAELIVAKQRNGPTGTAKLVFLKDIARFENPADSYRELPPGMEPVDGQDIPF